jgi:hypothetical protein
MSLAEPLRANAHYIPDSTPRWRRTGMAMYDDKKIANLVKKMAKQARPKTEPGQTYDKTAPKRVTDENDIERDKFFKEMKRREF